MNIRTASLGCARNGRAILSGISFDLTAGTCLVLRGPNGVGKTTLLKTLAGLLPPHQGTLQIDADQIAYAGHLDAVKTQMTVAENLKFWAGVYGTGDVHAALNKLELAALADRPAHTLSAGQKRRLGLGRLLVSGRDIWLLDEPTASLDSRNTALLARVISDHCAAGGIAILSTHLDLPIRKVLTLELEKYAATSQHAETDPFLDEAFT
jgi:heme exporter protein A